MLLLPGLKDCGLRILKGHCPRAISDDHHNFQGKALDLAYAVKTKHHSYPSFHLLFIPFAFVGVEGDG